ncbi:MAG: response regulator [Candidatus Margulisiibacteriota bacterium]|jgi:CheY-like chemotaxis protein
MIKILIADDEPNILMLTEVMFKETGFDVYTAVNGEEAIKKAFEIKPDIIITDVIMPLKDGFEVCRTVRNSQELSEIPIIILSAMGDEYNKITGFEGGADDYVTKPFNIEELKARVKALLVRHKMRKVALLTQGKEEDSAESVNIEKDFDVEFISSGIKELDQVLNGGLPKGSNILVIGSLGSGKSTFGRCFVAEGLKNCERSLFVAIDDSPRQIRNKLSVELNKSVNEYEDLGLIRFVDAYSWSSFIPDENEPFAVNGILELNQLSGVISDAGYELGQTIQNKLGGRRIIDSISSLLINFELPSVQRFINQIGRTALAFGGVTTLFVIEDGTVSEQVLNNIKYIMDGIIEFRSSNNKHEFRVSSMKWVPFKPDWIKLEN